MTIENQGIPHYTVRKCSLTNCRTSKICLGLYYAAAVVFLESYYFDEPKIGVIAAILIILYTQKLKHDHDFDRFQRAVRYQSGIHFVME